MVKTLSPHATVREIAEAALLKIRTTSRGHVYASRPGVVAATTHVVNRHAVTFRRKDGKVRMEVWPTDGNKSGCTVHALPADLERKAAAMLDTL